MNVALLAKLDEGGTSAKTMLDVLVVACWRRDQKVIGLRSTPSGTMTKVRRYHGVEVFRTSHVSPTSLLRQTKGKHALIL